MNRISIDKLPDILNYRYDLGILYQFITNKGNQRQKIAELMGHRHLIKIAVSLPSNNPNYLVQAMAQADEGINHSIQQINIQELTDLIKD